MLLKTIRKLEALNNGSSDFMTEKRSVFGQFVAFALAFVIKASFNLYLIDLPDLPESSSDEQLVWAAIWLMWSGLPITYSFIQNWQSFKSGGQIEDLDPDVPSE